MEINQTQKKKKVAFTKGTAIVLAGATFVAGSIGLAKLFSRTNNNLDNGDTSTSISYDITDQSLLLTEDFDINNEDAVRQRAKQIYGYSEKEYDVDAIMNIIYCFNGAYDKIVFPANKDKSEYVAEIILSVSKILDDNILDDAEVIRNLFYDNKDANLVPKEDQEIYAYMFMASMNDNPSAVDVSKQDAIRFAQIVNEHLENIKYGKIDQSLAQEYYDFYKNLKNRVGKEENPQINMGYSAILYKDIDSKNIFFTLLLDDSMRQELDENYANSYINGLLNDIRTKLSISVQPSIDKILEEGKNSQDLPPAYSKDYNEEDKKDAEQRPDAGDSTGESVLVDDGGNKVPSGGGHEETLNEPTTSITEEEIVVDIPGAGTHTEVTPGGKPVEGHITDNATINDEGIFYMDADGMINVKK